MPPRFDAARRRTLGLLAVLPAFAVSAPAQGAPAAARLEQLPRVGLGTWQTFDVGSDAAARSPLREVLREFAAGGGRLVDSSPMYGTSESVVGDLAAELGLHQKLYVATKVWTSGRDAGIRQMEESFRRLRTKKLDLMQVHNLVDVATHMQTLTAWKREGRVRHIGVTHYTASAHAEVERALVQFPCDFVQVNYSIAEPEAAQRLLPLARDRGIGVIVNRPFAEGAMFRKVRGKPLPDWAVEIGAKTWAQFFLKWILGHPAATCAIPGTARPEHVVDNLGAATGPLPDEPMRKRMAAHFEAV
jgi:diketogulonate reductase-like aldo/keto reductase